MLRLRKLSDVIKKERITRKRQRPLFADTSRGAHYFKLSSTVSHHYLALSVCAPPDSGSGKQIIIVEFARHHEHEGLPEVSPLRLPRDRAERLQCSKLIEVMRASLSIAITPTPKFSRIVSRKGAVLLTLAPRPTQVRCHLIEGAERGAPFLIITHFPTIDTIAPLRHEARGIGQAPNRAADFARCKKQSTPQKTVFNSVIMVRVRR